MKRINPITDPSVEVRRLARDMDKKELKERTEKAKALSKESEAHLVDYCYDCVRTTSRALEKIRKTQDECLKMYYEEIDFSHKEKWQAKVVIPKPYQTVKYATSVVKKAFDTEFISIENERDQDAAKFWRDLLKYLLSKTCGNFQNAFSVATEMAFAIGQSMEIKPIWKDGKLKFVLVEPWKISRDPDAVSRDPQSGMYWIHQEYVERYVLKQLEKAGRYQNIKDIGESFENEHLRKETLDQKKNMTYQKSAFRNPILVSEFWGTILDKNGDLLLPSATYTIAGAKVISPPMPVPYKTMRFPGVSFSPLPHVLRYDGRGLLESVMGLWKLMSNMLCLHYDSLNWIVNPPMEVDITSLVNPEDVDNFPGKLYLTRGTVSGQQAVRAVEHRFRTNEILANLAYADQNFQRGAFVTDAVQGLPGWRQDMTYREAAQNLEQSLSVFSLMGSELEAGALNAIMLACEVVDAYARIEDLEHIVSPEQLYKYVDIESPTGLSLPQLMTGSFHLSGVSAMMKDAEIMRNIKEVILPLTEHPLMAKYIKPYNLMKSIIRRLNLRDEDILYEEHEVVEPTQEEASQWTIPSQPNI